ncbi:endospore germination permease [Paenibacillus filicis]|uniref:Endospore germination permease n=1 Tax=Paenibacillus gyeongsangnamensis TaxID=3388067 RepID=A0ABT4Q5R1_9BACL|nr:endospore germination permease [Paenibacillus filicis]MCZ8512176.1 endospore germination permease [Paenibacillus filicis]
MKLSGSQIFWIITTMEFGMTALLTISPTIVEAKQDAWIAMAVAAVIGIIITFVATKLSLLYPGQTLIEYSQTILGKWLGKLVMIPYLLMWYSLIAVVLRQFTDFMVMNLLSRTPLLAVIIPMGLVVTIAASGGPQCLGRLSELVGPISYAMAFSMTFLLFRDLDRTAIFPIFVDTGLAAILKGALPGADFLGESIIIMMLVSFMSKPEQAPSRAIWGVAAASLLLIYWIMITLMIFGTALASNMWFPIYDAVRMISAMEFMQNLETLGIILWFFSVFIKMSLYLFVAGYGTAQWLGIKKWRYVLWSITCIVIIGAMIPSNIDRTSIDFPKRIGIPILLPINMIAIPLLLWIVGLVRRKAERANT